MIPIPSVDERTATLLALALFFGPCAVGLIFGALARLAFSGRPRLRRVLFVVTFAALFSSPFFILPNHPGLSIYDALSAATLFSAAAVFVGWPARFRVAHVASLLLFVGLLAGGLALVEEWFVAHPSMANASKTNHGASAGSGASKGDGPVA